MIVIRRMVDRQRAYTGIFLPGEPPKIFPTTDQEHARILAIYKQERFHEGIINDFSDYALGSDHLPPAFTPAKKPESGLAAAPESSPPEKLNPPRTDRGGASVPSSLWLTSSGNQG